MNVDDLFDICFSFFLVMVVSFLFVSYGSHYMI